ncbi:MAG: hemolysin family protein [Deltaproteobacteria bacterium]|jgi:CBS domain containing-hemolysin-like protein|nr:hemolysin family protein [Deltaproteobacteria bacterium]MCL5879484.1 hemolysin family protein [Deltaproteobacteria bacterium]MDA8304521.1 hemolysin family protein [Deltaproteobacteria bacterium]
MFNNLYLIYIIIIIASIFFEGFFAGSEIGIISFDKIKVKHKETQGNKLAKFLIKMTKRPESTFSTSLIGNNVAYTTASILATAIIYRYARSYTPFIVAVILTPIMVIFGEIIPKMVYRRHANSLMLKSIPLLAAFGVIFFPINIIFIAFSKFLNVIFKSKSKNVFLTKDELIKVLTISGNIEELKEYDKKIIKRIFDFRNKTAKDIMIPLINVVAVDEKASVKTARQILVESNYSRIPVYKDRIDNISGIAFAFDIYNMENMDKVISDIAKPVLFIPETLKISSIMIKMQKSHQQMVIVVDEYGGASGIVTFEDILEEIVGEIRDETDEEEPMYKKIGKNTYLINARLTLDELSELFNLKIERHPEADYETVSGLIMDRLGRIPVPGEKFTIDNLTFTITQSTSKSLKEVILSY